jgi:hypothetical protein
MYVLKTKAIEYIMLNASKFHIQTLYGPNSKRV